ncbi:MAG: hypothetical protein ACI4WT_01850, partial [Oligosphaeraceae bacterium]
TAKQWVVTSFMHFFLAGKARIQVIEKHRWREENEGGKRCGEGLDAVVQVAGIFLVHGEGEVTHAVERDSEA